jgi:hypothetical protein
MKSLLQRIVDASFFEWNDYYDALGGNSWTPRLFRVNLIGRSKEISEHGAAPPAFYELQDFIKNGAGAEGNEFVPTRGYLTVSQFPGATIERKWPDAAIVGFTLDRVGEGRYIQGEALAFAWQAVNQNPTAPMLVESSGQVYAIMIQIPGVVEVLIAHHGNTFVYFERDGLIYTFHAHHNTGCMAPEIGIDGPTVFYQIVESFRFTN